MDRDLFSLGIKSMHKDLAEGEAKVFYVDKIYWMASEIMQG
jgi:hypothetical protein